MLVTLPPMTPAVDVADLLLAAVARRKCTAVLIEPDRDSHTVSLERSAGNATVARLPSDVGDAVAARLALIAGMDVLGNELLGRLRVRVGREECEILISVNSAPDGLSAEIRRIVTAADRAGVATTDSDITLNQIGPYKLIDELGRGGTGVVYRAEHQALGKPVAIKVLYVDVASDPVAASRFIREARAASRARHPGIVDVTDFGTLHDGRSYLVMELVEGQTIDQLLGDGALDPLRAVLLIRQIALALEAAHRAGVVHRDLKPANIFILAEPERGDPVIKIGDFGAAKLETPGLSPAVSQNNLVFGTPYYMSPEHASGRPTDRRTDVYALGCVLFELISGQVPFVGETTFEIMTKQVNDPPPPLTSPYGPLPAAVERVVSRALAKSADHRYQSAAEMAGDLDLAAGVLRRAGWRRWLPL
jgi:eukaryotic-like serine/threonine-protein kinase